MIGVVLSGGRDDGSAGLFAVKARGGLAIVQDPDEAIMPNMPRSALNMVDVDFCLPVCQIVEVLVQSVKGQITNVTESSNTGVKVEDHATADPSTLNRRAIESRSPARNATVRCMSLGSVNSRSSNVSSAIGFRLKASAKNMLKHLNAHSGRPFAN